MYLYIYCYALLRRALKLFCLHVYQIIFSSHKMELSATFLAYYYSQNQREIETLLYKILVNPCDMRH